MKFVKDFLIAVIVFAGILLVFTVAKTETGDSALTMISNGELMKAETRNEDTTKFETSLLGVRTINKQIAEEKNAKRLAIYKNRLDVYTPPKGEVNILVTGYSSTPDQCWGDPFQTASGTRVHDGTMACPPQYPFGTKITIERKGTFVCEDRGGVIKGNHFDMWFPSRQAAMNWGKRIVVAEITK